MEFFKLLSEHAEGINMTLRIMHKNGKMTVGLLPDTTAKLEQLNLTGTPEELDAEFFNVIKKPMEIIGGLTTNVSQFTKQATEATKGNKAAQPAAEKPKVEKPQEPIKKIESEAPKPAPAPEPTVQPTPPAKEAVKEEPVVPVATEPAIVDDVSIAVAAMLEEAPAAPAEPPQVTTPAVETSTIPAVPEPPAATQKQQPEQPAPAEITTQEPEQKTGEKPKVEKMSLF